MPFMSYTLSAIPIRCAAFRFLCQLAINWHRYWHRYWQEIGIYFYDV